MEFCGCYLVWIEAVSGFGRRGKEGGDFSEMCPKNPRRKEKNPCKAEIRSKQVWELWVVFLRALLLFLAPKLFFSAHTHSSQLLIPSQNFP